MKEKGHFERSCFHFQRRDGHFEGVGTLGGHHGMEGHFERKGGHFEGVGTFSRPQVDSSRFPRFRVFRVFVFTGAFTCSVLAFSCHRMDCFGTYFTHAQSCDNVRVHSATEWTASVHTLRMPKAVITFVFIVLRNGLLRYIPYACPKL